MQNFAIYSGRMRLSEGHLFLDEYPLISVKDLIRCAGLHRNIQGIVIGSHDQAFILAITYEQGLNCTLPSRKSDWECLCSWMHWEQQRRFSLYDTGIRMPVLDGIVS